MLLLSSIFVAQETSALASKRHFDISSEALSLRLQSFNDSIDDTAVITSVVRLQWSDGRGGFPVPDL